MNNFYFLILLVKITVSQHVRSRGGSVDKERSNTEFRRRSSSGVGGPDLRSSIRRRSSTGDGGVDEESFISHFSVVNRVSVIISVKQLDQVRLCHEVLVFTTQLSVCLLYL